MDDIGTVSTSININDDGSSTYDADSYTYTKTTNLDTGILSTDEVTTLEADLRDIKLKYKRTRGEHGIHRNHHRNHTGVVGRRKHHKKKKMGHLLAGGFNNRTSSSPESPHVDMGIIHHDKAGRAATECTDYVICNDGFEVITDGPCELACQGQDGEQLCCDGDEACAGFTGQVCKDGYSCIGDSSCENANIESVVNGCYDYMACYAAIITSVVDGCHGNYSCTGAAYFGGSIIEIVDSCYGTKACMAAAAGYCYENNDECDYTLPGGSIGIIHGSCVGDYSCYYAAHIKGSVDEIMNSCHGHSACESIAVGAHGGGEVYYESSIGTIDGSCIGNFSCQYASYEGGDITEIVNSCNHTNACSSAAESYGSIGLIHDSCIGSFSCYSVAFDYGEIDEIVRSCHDVGACNYSAYGGNIAVIEDSCLGKDSCNRASAAGGDIGDILSSCRGAEACFYMAYVYGEIERLFDSCVNGERACFMAAYYGGSIGAITFSCKDGDYVCTKAAAGFCEYNEKKQYCKETSKLGGSIGDVEESCIDVGACRYLAYSEGSIRDGIENGCRGELACLSLGESSTIDGQINDCCNGVEICANVSSFEATDCNGEGTTSPTTSPTPSPSTSKPTTSKPTTSSPTKQDRSVAPTPTPYVTQFFDTTIIVQNVVNDYLRNIEQVCESDERKAVFDITLSEIVGHGLPDHQKVGSAVVKECIPDADADTLIVVQKLGIDVMCGSSCEDTKEEFPSNELAENIEDTMNDAIDDGEYTGTLQNNARKCDPPSECSGLTSASVNDPAVVSMSKPSVSA